MPVYKNILYNQTDAARDAHRHCFLFILEGNTADKGCSGSLQNRNDQTPKIWYWLQALNIYKYVTLDPQLP